MERFTGFLGGRQVGPPRCPSALTFGVADCVSMLLQTQNMTLVPTCVRMGFVVVPPSTGKGHAMESLENLAKSVSWKVEFCDFSVRQKFSAMPPKSQEYVVQSLRLL